MNIFGRRCGKYTMVAENLCTNGMIIYSESAICLTECRISSASRVCKVYSELLTLFFFVFCCFVSFVLGGGECARCS